MKKMHSFRWTSLLVILAFLLGGDLWKASAADQPNIVFILVDDLGYADVGFNGSKFYETPHIDSLAETGLVFDHAYMYPTCSPSRTALFTGKQSFRTGVYTVPVLEKGTAEENIFSRWTVPQEHPIYAQPLADVGYQSIHLGKWHIVGPYPEEELAMQFPLSKKLSQPDPFDFSWVMKHQSEAIRPYYPEGRGFVKNVGGTYRGDPALEDGGYKSKTGGYFAPFSNPFIEQKPDDEWLTDRLTDDAIEFMDGHRDGPFLINLHYYTVHRPIVARSEALLEKYMTKPGDPELGQGMETGKWKEIQAGYATMIESLDDNVGRLTAFLDESGLRENTVIIFTSDNGQNGRQSANTKLRGSKGYIYEGGIRVPLFVNQPGKVAPRRSDAVVSVLDFFPTMMELAGIDYEGPLDGWSLVPQFDDEDLEFENRPMFWHLASQYKHGTCTAMRQGDYKLIQFLADGKLELYNLKTDPLESENLAKTESTVADWMLKEMTDWRKANEVPLPPNSILDY